VLMFELLLTSFGYRTSVENRFRTYIFYVLALVMLKNCKRRFLFAILSSIY